ncbi:glycosyltransferase family 2 protein [Noviherbaspirillum soli]|uniref:glycosyltransferase family 2 protein n=1 Tax=Noviherbaspirillum soli TaxID=1064518 RepID=UPI00188D32C2|nr:glycosyltransferase family 2 protein [Noviherbaspirillum soli]
MRDMANFPLPKVSVIIPCFNQGSYLAEAVISAKLAYSGPLEVIIIDDGSTEPKIERWLKEAQNLGDFVKVVRQKNLGLSGARNTGISLATGEFIQLLDSDDILVPQKIDSQVAHFLVAENLDVSVGNFLLCDDRRDVFSKPDEAIANFSLKIEDFLYCWERGFVIPIHCALFRRDLLANNPFDESARAKEDWLFWCRIVSGGARLSYINRHFAIYRQHASSMRRSYVSMGKTWLFAALKIDQIIGKQHPDFFESALSWFQQCYRSNPLYNEELRNFGARHEQSGGINKPIPLPVSFSDDADSVIKSLVNIGAEERLPSISVVIPVYNHYEHFLQCLTSLGKQGINNLEIVCVNDASTDQRISPLLRKIAESVKNFVVIDHSVNTGISETQNEAVNAAKGEYIAFLDCDDALVPNALKQVADKLELDGTIDYLFTDRYDIDHAGNVIRLAKYGGYHNISHNAARPVRADLLDGMIASHLKVIRRRIYQEAGGTGAQFTGCQDWELALKIAEFGNFFYLPEALYRHRIHENSVTSSEHVSQFRKTNELRRIFAKKWLWTSGGKSWQRPSSNEENGAESTRWFDSSSVPSLDDLKESWRQGKRCCFDFMQSHDLPAVNFIREFNSYFDAIRWCDPAVPSALIGYLWSHEILKEKS